MKKILLSFVAIVALSLGLYAQWTEQATGFSTASRGINYISIVNPNVVWATAYDGSGGGAFTTDFTRTINGGNLWTPGTVVTSANYGLGNISAIDENTAWVALYNAAGAQDNSCGIYKTTNGGVTWAQQPGALQGSASFADNVFFWNANEGMCHGDVKDGYFEIYTTSNGGSTWTRVPQANINATVATGEGGWTSVIETAGDSSIFFGSNKGKIYISHDRGHNWVGKATGIVAATNGGVQHIAFIDAMNGYVAQDNNPTTATDTTLQIYGTTDGGNTWAPVSKSGWVFSNCLAAVKHTPSTYVTTGANVGTTAVPHVVGSSYSFDGHAFSGITNTVGTPAAGGSQFLYTSFINDSVGWSGHFNVDATTGGIWKFVGHLAPCDFTSDVTAVVKGGTVVYTITSGSYSSSIVSWAFPGGTPATSTNKHPSVIYNTPGTYNVTLTVTNTWGVTTKVKSNYLYVGGVGINENLAASVSVFPNPVKNILNIQGSMNIEEVTVTNMVGQVVLNLKSDNTTLIINTSNFKSGVYNLRVKMADGFINKKIVVN